MALGAVGLTGCSSATAAAVTAPPSVQAAGAAVSAAWQAGPLDMPVVVGDLVVGAVLAGGASVVRGLDARTGHTAWTANLGQDQPIVLTLPAADGIVVVQVGHYVGHAPAMVGPLVARLVTLDAATGHRLWDATVDGETQDVPLGITPGTVVTGDAAGTLTARATRTGTVQWRRPRPDTCEAPGGRGYDEALAADSTLVAVSYHCDSGGAVAQRLDPATGRPTWTWTSATTSLTVQAASATSATVVLAGVLPETPSQRTPRFRWPGSLGPAGDGEAVVALDAATGTLRWVEDGGPQVRVAVTDGAVCEVVPAGYECRNATSGAPQGRVETTGQGSTASPPDSGDGYAGFADGSVAVALPPERTGVPVQIASVRPGTPLVRVRVAIGGTTRDGSNVQTFVVAGGTLPDGSRLFLLRRVDLPDYPLVALLAR